MPQSARKFLNLHSSSEQQLSLRAVLLAFLLMNAVLAVAGMALVFWPDIFAPGLRLGLLLAGSELLILLLAYLFIVRQAHALAGCSHALQREFERLREGDLTVRVKLRKDDYFKETTAFLNEVVDDLESRVSRMNELVEKAARGEADTKRLTEEMQKELAFFKVRER